MKKPTLETNVEPPRLQPRERHQYHYVVEDLLYELSRHIGLPYLQLANKSLRQYLQNLEARGLAYRQNLKLYPDVIYEPLDQYYLLRRASGKLDIEMLNDLLFAGGWKETNWGLWLAAIAPQAQYVELLKLVKPEENYSTDILELAIASCTLQVPPRLQEHFAVLQRVREMLNEMPELKTPMRIWIKSDNRLEHERAAVLKAYREGGLSQALPLARRGLLGYYRQSYANWIMRGAPAVSEQIEGDLERPLRE